MKGYWVICTKTYEVDNIEVGNGFMDFHTSPRPIVNKDWRRATQDEIDTRKYRNAQAFNLKNV